MLTLVHLPASAAVFVGEGVSVFDGERGLAQPADAVDRGDDADVAKLDEVLAQQRATNGKGIGFLVVRAPSCPCRRRRGCQLGIAPALRATRRAGRPVPVRLRPGEIATPSAVQREKSQPLRDVLGELLQFGTRCRIEKGTGIARLPLVALDVEALEQVALPTAKQRGVFRRFEVFDFHEAERRGALTHKGRVRVPAGTIPPIPNGMPRYAGRCGRDRQ